jgi:hypothetical protein
VCANIAELRPLKIKFVPQEYEKLRIGLKFLTFVIVLKRLNKYAMVVQGLRDYVDSTRAQGKTCQRCANLISSYPEICVTVLKVASIMIFVFPL